jgi:hypothetical protein
MSGREKPWREQRLLSPALSTMRAGKGEDVAAKIGFRLKAASNIGMHRCSGGASLPPCFTGPPLFIIPIKTMTGVE